MKTLQLLAVVSVGVLAACKSDYEIDVIPVGLEAWPAEAQIDSRSMSVPKGVAIGAKIIPIEDDEQIDDDVEFRPDRPGIIGIDFGPEDQQFIIYGIEQGATSVDVLFDDDQVFTMSAQVTAPVFE